MADVRAGATTELRAEDRAAAEAVLVRAVEEEVRRSGGRTDGTVLLSRARTELDEVAAPAGEEYAAYLRAADTVRPGRLAERLAPRQLAAPASAVAAAAATALLFDLNGDVGHALSTAATVGAAGTLGALVQITGSHRWAAHQAAGRRSQPGGVEQLRLTWLTALELRGVRPYLDQQRLVAGASERGSHARAANGRGGPKLRGSDRSGAARRRNLLEQSFRQLPAPDGAFSGRRAELNQITQWVHQARASTETRPTVIVLHGPPGSGRTTLAVRAAHELRDEFRGACVVDLRGDSAAGPLSTRDALLHLLNRLGAPREQLFFRDRPAHDQHLRRLTELYHQQLTAVPVTVVLDDAGDPEQVRTLIPERSDSLVLVTAREPLALSPELPAWVHQLPLEPLDASGAEELLRDATQQTPAQASRDSGEALYDGQAYERINELCGGLPFALRLAGSALLPAEDGAESPTEPGVSSGDGDAADAATGGSVTRVRSTRTAGELAEALADAARTGERSDPGTSAPEPPDPASAAMRRVLALRYADQPEIARRLLRRLALAGRASLGANAAAALLGTDEAEADEQLQGLARAGLVQLVRGRRYRLHDLVRRFARARLMDEEPSFERGAAQERLIRSYAELADSVIRLVDGKTSTRADHFGGHGFSSLEAALRWLDDESSFITGALRHTNSAVDQSVVLHLLGALCDYCLLRGDLYRLGEINELAEAIDQGLLVRSVQWRTGVAARQLGELDKARNTLSSVVDLYLEADHTAGAARAQRELGITLQQQGQLKEAEVKLRQALAMQTAGGLPGDRAWTLHALAAVARDRGRLAEALELLEESLTLHQESESVHGQAWAHFQLGQVRLRQGRIADAEEELRQAMESYGRTQDSRGQAWALTQLARCRLYAGEADEAVQGLRGALAQHRDSEDARGEAWTMYYLGMALEETGDRPASIRELERARTMFNRMRDVYGLSCARHHSGRVTRDQRAAETGSLQNSGFARQLLEDARKDFRRMGAAHSEAWSLVELAVVDAGNSRLAKALELTDEALSIFTTGYQEVADRDGANEDGTHQDGADGAPDLRGADWARFLRCTLLPFASPGGSVVGTAVAQQELAELLAATHPARDPALEDSAEAYALMLERGISPESGWQAWRLGMVPSRHARDVMGVTG